MKLSGKLFKDLETRVFQKMGRIPCCEKKGLRKGAWTREEDETLVAYIQNHGPGCWHTLPKKAGLLRCGKSCRFRWMNYLKPDVKRGNYSREEEETIIKLHELFGNRWSRIAAALPGRTDNEIKNVWHSHLSKRRRQNPMTQKTSHSTIGVPEFNAETSWDFQSESLNPNFQISRGIDSSSCNQGCQQQSSCEFSETSSISSNSSTIIAENHIDFCDIKEEFFEYDWPDAFWSENSVVGNEFVPMMFVDLYPQESFSNFSHTSSTSLNVVGEYHTGLANTIEDSFENFWSESF